MRLSKELLGVLACPRCKSNVRHTAKKDILTCKNRSCGRAYKVEDDIPIMLQ